jgi:hypothetical protein
MAVNMKFARTIFGAALALYVLWLAALFTMGIVTGTLPAERAIRSEAPQPTPEKPNN